MYVTANLHSPVWARDLPSKPPRTLRKIQKNQENKKAWPKEAESLQGTTATAPPPPNHFNYAHQSLLGETPTTEEASRAGDVRGPDKAKTARKSPPPGPTQSLPKFDADKDEACDGTCPQSKETGTICRQPWGLNY